MRSGLSGRVPHDHRAQPGAEQAADSEREHRRPLHGRHHREDQCGHPVGQSEDDVLARVGMGQCLAAEPQEQRQQQHARRGAEVAAVDADREDRDTLQREREPLPATRRARVVRGGRTGNRIAREANPSSAGTIFSKPSAGVDNSSTAPVTPPTAAKGSTRFSNGPWPASSGRDPRIEPTPLNTSATVLVTLAVTGGSPPAAAPDRWRPTPGPRCCRSVRRRFRPRRAAALATRTPAHCARPVGRGTGRDRVCTRDRGRSSIADVPRRLVVATRSGV